MAEDNVLILRRGLLNRRIAGQLTSTAKHLRNDHLKGQKEMMWLNNRGLIATCDFSAQQQRLLCGFAKSFRHATLTDLLHATTPGFFRRQPDFETTATPAL
jgi:hypothetical protein